MPVQKQPDGHNCDVIAVAFAAEILDAKSPTEAIFDVFQMRNHFIHCLERTALTPFPEGFNRIAEMELKDSFFIFTFYKELL